MPNLVRGISNCLWRMVSLVAEMFKNNIFSSYYTSEATENIIFAHNAPSVFFIHAYRKLVPVLI